MRSFDLRTWTGFAQAGGNLQERASIEHVAVHSAHVTPRSLFVALSKGRRNGHEFVREAAARGARFCLVDLDFPDPGIAHLQLLRVPDTLQALQHIAHSYRMGLKAQVVGITGSYGKTLTKDLLAFLLQGQFRVARSPESFNSQIGVAISLMAIESDDQIALIEAGISQPGEMAKLAHMIQPDYAVLTCLGDAHLSSLGRRAVIATEKSYLLQAVGKQGWILTSDRLPSKLAAACRAKIFVSSDSVDDLPSVHPHPDDPLLYTLAFPDREQITVCLRGTFPHLHPMLNLCVKAAYLLGAHPDTLAEGLREYYPEPMRTEVWTSPLGVTFINDCYGADALSLQHSLNLLDQRGQPGILLFGGLAQEQPISDDLLEHVVAKSACLREIVLFGQRARSVRGHQSNKIFTYQPNHSAALRYLRTLQHPGQTVLIKGAKRQSLEGLRHDFAEGVGDTRLEVNMDAIRHNVTTLKRHHAHMEVIAMIKADGYGVGIRPLSRFLPKCGISMLGVAHTAEAIALRLAGVESRIFVFSASPHEAAQIVQWDLDVGVSDVNLVHHLHREASQRGTRVRLHLHIDTGMTRFGCRMNEAHALARFITTHSSTELYGLFSHLSSADETAKDNVSQRQIDLFAKSLADLEKEGYQFAIKHLANTAGATRFEIPGVNAVRVGLALFGLTHHEESHPDIPLRSALTLTSRLAAIHTCNRGDCVSYGGKYLIKEDGTRIGVVPAGYFDGIRKSFSGRASVRIRGKPAPIVGEVCMDFCMVDLTAVPDAKVDDAVLFFGQDATGMVQTALSLAETGLLSLYELISGLGPRVQRLYVYDGESRDLL